MRRGTRVSFTELVLYDKINCCNVIRKGLGYPIVLNRILGFALFHEHTNYTHTVCIVHRRFELQVQNEKLNLLKHLFTK
jgi:hypothetical protein